MLVANFLEIQPGGSRPHFPMVRLKEIPHTVTFSGLVAPRIVSKTSVGLAVFPLHLECAVAETTALTQQMATIGRAAEHRAPWTADHQLLCIELRLCIVLSTRCILPAFIPLPLQLPRRYFSGEFSKPGKPSCRHPLCPPYCLMCS